MAVALPPEAEEYLSWLGTERGRSPNTLAAYRRDLLAFWRWYQAGAGAPAAPVGAVTEGDLLAYVGTLRNEGRAASSITRATVAIRSLTRFLVEEGVAPTDPLADVEVPRVPRGLPKALDESDVAALIDAVQGSDPVARRDRAILEVLYGTGARISELVGLSLGDVDLDGGTLRLFGKGSKERIVPLGRLARMALAGWLDDAGRGALEPERWARRGDAEAVLLNQRGGRLSRQGAWGVVRRYGRIVGIEDRLSPHVLRHSCATHMLDHGADIRSVQELLGHASVSTTQLYTKVSMERLRRTYLAAHPRASAR